MNFVANESRQKLRGGYYTPLDLAVFLSRWIKEIKPKNILEPSCGDGVFFDAMSKIGGFGKSNILGIELDVEEARKSKEASKKLSKAKIINSDFLEWALKQNLGSKEGVFDAVIGNPPFIRYQYLPRLFQERSERIFKELSLPFTKHTNAWVPFVLASLSLLKPGGRLAMVIPAEIIHVLHAQSLRSYLGKECRRLVIIDPQEIWFDETLQGAVLLLAEKLHSTNDHAQGLGIYSVKGREFLDKNPEDIFLAPKSMNGRTIQGKWTYALLEPSVRKLLDEITRNPNVHVFETVADVDVGIVTGANEYFLVSDEIVQKFKLKKWAYPMFGRSEHCPGVIYDEEQHRNNQESGKPTNFIWFNGPEVESVSSAKQYIEYGEAQRLHTRYKCSVRPFWYSVPSVYSSEVGMLKRAHNAPRLILNKIGAYTTDTAYRIRTKGVSSKELVGSFINSLTALCSELEGRHYGGGVLELTPSEIEKVLIPLPQGVKVDLGQLDKDVKELPTEKVLQKQDKLVLTAVGLTPSQQKLLHKSWKKLRNRRQRVDSND